MAGKRPAARRMDRMMFCLPLRRPVTAKGTGPESNYLQYTLLGLRICLLYGHFGPKTLRHLYLMPKCRTLRHRYRNVSKHFGKVQQANSAFSSCRPASLEQTACSPSTTQNCTFHGGVLCLLINNSNCVFNAATTAYCILLYCIVSYRIFCNLLLSSATVQLCKRRGSPVYQSTRSTDYSL